MRIPLFTLLVMVMHLLNAQQPISNTPGFFHVVTTTAADEQNIYVGGFVAAAGSNTSHALFYENESRLVSELFPDTDYYVSAIVPDENDGWFLVKSTFSNSRIAELIKMNSDGNVDHSFSLPKIKGFVSTMYIKDSMVYLGGSFDSIGDVRCENIARININQQQVDESWAVKIYRERYQEVRAIVADNHHVYIGGYFTTVNDTIRNHIVRVSLVNGVLDRTWNPAPDAGVYAMILDGDSLYVGGEFGQIGGQSRNHLAKINIKTGSLIHHWLPAGDKGGIYAMVLINNHLYAGGSLKGYWNNPGYENSKWIDVPYSNLTKYNKITSEVDTLWKPAYQSDVQTMASMGNHIVIGGSSDNITLSCIAKYDTLTGLIDTTFNLNLVGYARNMKSSQNKLMLIGYFYLKDYVQNFGISRFNKSSGEIDKNWIPVLDLGWNSDNDYFPKIIIPDADDIYVANSNEISLLFKDKGKAMINEGIKPVVKIDKLTGAVDENWSPDIYGEIYTMVHDQEALYIGGLFATTGSDSIPYLAKIDKANGNIDPLWNPVVNGFISKLQIDGELLYIGGDFTSINGKPIQHLARISLQTGIVDEAWLPNPNQAVYEMFVDDQHLFLTGMFQDIGGANMPFFAKIHKADGAASDGWLYQIDYLPISIIEINNDLCATVMTQSGVTSTIRINKENGNRYDDGLSNMDILHWGDAIPGVFSLLHDEQKLYLGGMFTNINSQNRTSFVGFDIPNPAITTQPNHLSTCENNDQSLSIEVYSEALPVSYQWQANHDGSGWISIAGATSPFLSTNEIDESLHGVGLRCMVSDRNGSVISDTVVVEVYPVYETIEDLTICQGTSLTWHGRNLSEAGTYSQTYTTVNGCDSTFVLNLFVQEGFRMEEEAAVCEGEVFNWRGNIYTASGTYYDQKAAEICDSLWILNLTIHPNFEITENISICDGDIYTWQGNEYTVAGKYVEQLKTNFGCDSTISLELEVEMIDDSVIQDGFKLIALAAGAEYQWYQCETDQPIVGAVNQEFTPVSNGDYYVLITQNNCSKKSSCITVTGVGINGSSIKSHFILYPNPSNGFVFLETGTPFSDAEVEIVNTKGQRVAKYIGQTGTHFVFDLSKQKNGYYQLIVTQIDGEHIIPFLLFR